MVILNVIFRWAIVLGGVLLPGLCFPQNLFEELETLQKKEAKPVVVFIHTDWCSYCKAMESLVFKNEKVAKKLNESFYFIPLNAEERNPITIFGKTFSHKPTGFNTSNHELAEMLGNFNGSQTYPSLVFINPNHEIIFQQSGFVNADDFLKLLEVVLLNKG